MQHVAVMRIKLFDLTLYAQLLSNNIEHRVRPDHPVVEQPDTAHGSAMHPVPCPSPMSNSQEPGSYTARYAPQEGSHLL